MLAAGLKNAIVVEENQDIADMVCKLFKNPFNEREDIFKLQHNMYVGLIRVELAGIDKELIHINARSAKLRKDLRSVSNDDVFKTCTNLLDKKKLNDRKDIGLTNDRIWSVALDKKKANDLMVKNWKNALTSMHEFYKSDSCDDVLTVPVPVQAKDIKSLSISTIIFVNVEPPDTDETNDVPITFQNRIQDQSPTYDLANETDETRRTVDARRPLLLNANKNEKSLPPTPKPLALTNNGKHRPFTDQNHKQRLDGNHIVYNDRMKVDQTKDSHPFRSEMQNNDPSRNRIQRADSFRNRNRSSNQPHNGSNDNRYRPYNDFRYK